MIPYGAKVADYEGSFLMSPAHLPLDAHASESEWAGESEWAVGSEAEELADALRSAMSEEYAGASDEAIYDALEAVLESVSPAEAFNLTRAFKQAATSATQLVKDPTFIQVASVAAPLVGGALGGPLGAGLGTLASKALLGAAAPPSAAAPPAPPVSPPVAAPPAPPVSPPVAAPPARPEPPPAAPPAPAPPPVGIAQPPAPAPVPSAPAPSAPELPAPAPGPAPSLAGGSTAAAQALVLTQEPYVLRSLLATALGRHGRRRVSGIPVAQVLALISQVLGQAAADADQLMYTEQQADSSETVTGEAVGDPYRSMYADLIAADNLEAAEAAEQEGLI